VENGEVDTRRVDTQDNLADILTKALPRHIHEDLVERMGMDAAHEHDRIRPSGQDKRRMPSVGEDGRSPSRGES
jgi:hypothetical protein